MTTQTKIPHKYENLGICLSCNKETTECDRCSTFIHLRPVPVIKPVNVKLSNPLNSLTPRKIEILKLTASGFTVKEIGLTLHICSNTIKNHLYDTHKILKVSNSIAAIIKCLQLGIFKLEEIEVK